MLQRTLHRLKRVNPPSRTLTVIGADQGDIAMPQLQGLSDHVFCQPSSRDTGVALYVALAMVKRWTPNAIVTITPADHYVSPAETYIEQVRAAQGIAARNA
jgi:mannose-1-phosphate guanylyltransferase